MIVSSKTIKRYSKTIKVSSKIIKASSKLSVECYLKAINHPLRESITYSFTFIERYTTNISGTYLETFPQPLKPARVKPRGKVSLSNNNTNVYLNNKATFSGKLTEYQRKYPCRTCKEKAKENKPINNLTLIYCPILYTVTSHRYTNSI